MGHFSALGASGFQTMKEPWELKINCKKLVRHQCQNKDTHMDVKREESPSTAMEVRLAAYE